MTEHLGSLTVAAWDATGRNPIGRPVTYGNVETCGVCGRRTDVTPASKALSGNFGSWEHIAPSKQGRRWLCEACVYALRAPQLRQKMTVITAPPQPSVTHLAPAQMADLLARPVPADTAVLVPLAGKKILTSRAEWGRVTTDHACLTWQPRHAHILRVTRYLRARGFGEGALAQPTPPVGYLLKLPSDTHDRIRALWHELDAARADKSLLPLFLRLSRGSA